MGDFDKIAKQAQAEEKKLKEDFERRMAEGKAVASTEGTVIRYIKNSYIKDLNEKLKAALADYRNPDSGISLQDDDIIIPINQVEDNIISTGSDNSNQISTDNNDNIISTMPERDSLISTGQDNGSIGTDFDTEYKKAMDELEKACKAMDTCVRLENNPAWGSTKNYEEKQKAVYEAQTALSACLDSLNVCMNYEASEATKFRQLITAVTEAAVAYENVTEGTLDAPAFGSSVLNGRYVNTIHAIKESSPKITVSEPQKFQNKSLVYSDKTQRDFTNYALFPQEPTQHDVVQGYLGDCYLLSSLALIAANDPDKIREAIKDHHNGYVTVRFFDDDQNPVYVTVEKTLPQVVSNGSAHDIYASNSLWVGLIEKAYAASGLNGIVDHQNHIRAMYGYSMDFQTATAGTQYNFMSHFLGTYKDELMHDTKISTCKNFTKEKTDAQIEKNARELGPKLYESFKRGDFISCGINADTKFPLKGLPSRHAYSVMSVEAPQQDGKQYITVRNPHASDGIYYKKDGSFGITKAAGLSRLEMKDFFRYFDEMATVQNLLTPQSRLGKQTLNLYKKCFEATVKKLAFDLGATRGTVLSHGSNEFKKFYNAARACADVFDNCKNPSVVADHLRALEKAAKDYKFHRVTDGKTPEEALKPRPSERFKAACIVENMMKFFHNPDLEVMVRDNERTEEFEGHSFDYREYSADVRTLPQETDIRDAFREKAEDCKSQLSLMLNDNIRPDNGRYASLTKQMALYKAISDTVGQNMKLTGDDKVSLDEIRRRCSSDALKRYGQVLEGHKDFKKVFRNSDPAALKLLQDALANDKGLDTLQNKMMEEPVLINEAEMIKSDLNKNELEKDSLNKVKTNKTIEISTEKDKPEKTLIKGL